MFDEIFLTFVECAKRGRWEPIRQETNAVERLEPYMNGYKALAKDAEVWIVRGDGLRRAFSFKPYGKLWIGTGMIKFYNSELEEEIAVDEDEKSGKEPRGKLDFG
jgi:hypothetical protein